MVIVKPFAAVRPDPVLAARICELPYDVLSTAEARAAAAGNPLSFFHVSKPEIDLPPHTDPYDPRVYEAGARAFSGLIAKGALKRDVTPGFYLYRQVMGNHSQLGLAAVASCEDYLANRIRKHELTRLDKEDDRVRHIESLDAQTGPAFLIYRADPVLDACLREHAAERPEVDFTASDGVRHTSWTVRDPDARQLIESRFAAMPCLYIADGHHRTAAAARVYQLRQGAGSSAFFLSVLFPHNQLQILPYHRVVKDLNGQSSEAFLQKLGKIFHVHEPGPAQSTKPHQFGLYLGGSWSALELRAEFTEKNDPLECLDVGILQRHVLGPLLAIDDPRTSQRIHFVGGIRGTPELERLVDGGEFACAFSLFPTGVDELMAVADQGGIMPPKSTWFEPKLRDAMFCHMLQ